MTRGLPNKMNHDRLWAAIDAIAHRHGLSPSGLARRAGLDATAFNKSKRFTGDGRPRWPSTESVAKILDATGHDLDDLAKLIDDACDDRLPLARAVPFLDLGRPADGFFDGDGRPMTTGDDVRLPGDDEDVFALTIADDTGGPLYRRGDVLVISPRAQIHRGDRVVVCGEDGRFDVQVFVSRHGGVLETETLPPGSAPVRRAAEEARWVARILWVSQ